MIRNVRNIIQVAMTIKRFGGKICKAVDKIGNIYAMNNLLI